MVKVPDPIFKDLDPTASGFPTQYKTNDNQIFWGPGRLKISLIVEPKLNVSALAPVFIKFQLRLHLKLQLWKYLFYLEIKHILAIWST